MNPFKFLSLGSSFIEATERSTPLKVTDGLLPDFGPVQEAKAGGAKAVKTVQSISPPVTLTEQSRRRAAASLFVLAEAMGLIDGGRERNRRRQPRGAQALTQGEFSLDRVRVMRNDLADADLEVVIAESPRRNTRSARVAEAPQKGSLTAALWKRWGSAWGRADRATA